LQHAPQWWTYELKAKFFPKRDTHDGPRRHRYPSVYPREFYEEIRRRRGEDIEPPIPALVIVKAPNILIPLNGLFNAQAMPMLGQLPPPWPMPTLTRLPPPFRMATQAEMDADDEFIIRMLLEE